MNNNYLDFNLWAYNYYLERNTISNIGTLAIEVTEIENYCKRNSCDLKFKEIISYDWSKLLLQETNKIPKYFGLIALQCYAASMMQDDGISNTGINDYQTRFIGVSGITNIQELQGKFKFEFMGNPIQEKIWIEAKKFLSKIDFEILIPDQSKGAGRYVQYPKKQVVLNQEDLKEYFNLFEVIKEKFDVISFSEFKKYFKNNFNKYQFKRRNNLINNRSEIENNIKVKQIFDFYCSDNWRDLKKELPINKEKGIQTNYILSYNEFVENKIKLFKGESSEICFSRSLFEKNSIKGIVFFKKSEEYNNEYDFINYLEEGKEYILVTNNKFSSTILKKITENFTDIEYEFGEYSFYKGIIDRTKVPIEFIEILKESYPLEIVGVKISQKRQYLKSYPPFILNSKNVNYKIIPDYNLSDPNIGNYKIRVPGFSNLNFEIVENPYLNSVVYPRNIGLKLKDLNIVENNFDVQGLQYFGKEEFKKENLNINNWIKAQTRKTKIETSNIILKSIIKSKYGK